MAFSYFEWPHFPAHLLTLLPTKNNPLLTPHFCAALSFSVLPLVLIFFALPLALIFSVLPLVIKMIGGLCLAIASLGLP